MVRTLSFALKGEPWLANWKGDCGISLVEFPRFSLVDISAGKMECPMGNSLKIPSRPRGVSEEKMRQKPSEKKSAENYLPYTSRYVNSYEVISGDFRWCNFRWRHFWSLPVMQLPVTSFPVTSLLPVTAPPQKCDRFNMIYYYQFSKFLFIMVIV